MSVFCILKIFTPYSYHCRIFYSTFSATTSFQFVSWWICIMVITWAGAIAAASKAVSKSRENEKRCKSTPRKRKWHERQSAERWSEIWQADLMGHAEGRACLSEERWSEIWQTDLTPPPPPPLHPIPSLLYPLFTHNWSKMLYYYSRLDWSKVLW